MWPARGGEGCKDGDVPVGASVLVGATARLQRCFTCRGICHLSQLKAGF